MRNSIQLFGSKDFLRTANKSNTWQRNIKELSLNVGKLRYET